jgi:hypothetical protein
VSGGRAAPLLLVMQRAQGERHNDKPERSRNEAYAMDDFLTNILTQRDFQDQSTLIAGVFNLQVGSL